MKETMKAFSLYAFVMVMAGSVVTMAYLFYSAYMAPTKSLIMHVNRLGEGAVEAFVIIPATLFCAAMAVFAAFNQFRGSFHD